MAVTRPLGGRTIRMTANGDSVTDALVVQGIALRADDTVAGSINVQDMPSGVIIFAAQLSIDGSMYIPFPYGLTFPDGVQIATTQTLHEVTFFLR